MKLVPELDLACNQHSHAEKLFVTNQKPQLPVYTFRPVCRYAFHHLVWNFKNLPGIELTNDFLTLSFFHK